MTKRMIWLVHIITVKVNWTLTHSNPALNPSLNLRNIINAALILPTISQYIVILYHCIHVNISAPIIIIHQEFLGMEDLNWIFKPNIPLYVQGILF